MPDRAPSPTLPPASLTPTFRRRELLQLAAAGAALAGAGCQRPPEKILPYVDQPPEVTPGVALHYATSMVTGGYAVGLLVEAREGRPTKIEGNPAHPASLGASGAFEQASVLGLYDPLRARSVLRGGRPDTWRRFSEQVARRPAIPGLRFVLPPQSSEVHAGLFQAIARRHPDARFVCHAAVDRSASAEASTKLYGGPMNALYRFSQADAVLSLDADFLDAAPMSLRWAREYAHRRRLGSPDDDMGRLYVAEPSPSPTGSLADHRVPMRAVDVPAFGAAVFAAVLDQLEATGQLPPLPPGLRSLVRAGGSSADQRVARAIAGDLARSRGRSVVVPGEDQPVETHLLAHLMNHALGNVGETVVLRPSPLCELPGRQSLPELADDLRVGRAQTVVMLESNPVYTAPPELELGELLRRAPTSACLSMHRDETAQACQWSLPASHYLESWGDGRAFDGTLSLVQPLIRPLYDTRTTTSVLADFAGYEGATDHDLVKARYTDPEGKERAWHELLQRGFVDDSQLPSLAIEPDLVEGERALVPGLAPPSAGLELHFETSPKVYDGRFATNAWLQELPHPLTKVTWGNAALVSPAKAATLGLDRGDEVELRAGGRSVTAPVYVLPGHADDAVTLALGYGRSAEAPDVDGVFTVGTNAYSLRTRGSEHGLVGVEVRKTGRWIPLAITQDHGELHGREEIAQHHTLAHYREQHGGDGEGGAPEPGEVRDGPKGHEKETPSLLPVVLDEDTEQWAMTIDTMVCTGCSSCVIACQAENNIPVVGAEGVRNAREMHWLRIDRYFLDGEVELVNQPMLCQHCEKAPCEYVCPVNATVHSPDGLNEMVYNRCVGTRFCSNNCPYKVRRFNWVEYLAPEPTHLQQNPDVTVRERGVMEKCTYCVQRLRRAQRDARAEGRAVEDGEVQTACSQACPTGAIQFGLLHHERSEMVRWRKQPRSYAVLHHLGTEPRTKYLAKVQNLHPELK